MATWERATSSGAVPGSRVDVTQAGNDSMIILSPKFRLNDGSGDYGVVGFGGTKVVPSGVVGPTLPSNTVAPTMADTTPTIGDSVSASTASDGTWTGTATISYAKQLQKNSADVTSPLTILEAHAGGTLRTKVTATNTAGSVIAYTAATAAIPAPSGSIFISDYNPATHAPVNNGTDPRWASPGPYFFYPLNTALATPRRWYLDSAYNAGQVVSTDNKVVRYTVASTDVMNVAGYFSDSAGTNRNTISERETDAYSNTTEQFLELAITVPAGAALDHTWCSLWESHVYGPSIAQQMELIILANGRFASTSHYRNGSTDTVRNSGSGTWADTAALTRGQRYVFGLWVRPHATTGQIVIVKDGTQVLNFTGPVGYGTTTTSWRNQIGIYRGGATNSLSVDIEILQHVTGAANTLTFPTPPARSYGSNLVTGTFTAADAGTFATDTDTAFWRATSGGSIGPSNIPGGYLQINGLTPGDIYQSEGTTKRGTMTNAKNVVFNGDGSFAELNSYITTNTTDTDYAFDVTIPASGQVRLYWGGQASASSQTAFHHKANMKFRKVL